MRSLLDGNKTDIILQTEEAQCQDKSSSFIQPQLAKMRSLDRNKTDIILQTEGAQCQDKSSCFIQIQIQIRLQLAKIRTLVKLLENMICSSYPNHICQTVAGSILTLTEQSIELTIKLSKHSVGALNEDLGDDCDPDGKSDNVWKHFTKIRSANDPDEVYAACHRCDKLLKAHPKKHGTSHLKRHIRMCSSSTNPSTDEDREMLHRLRTVLDDPYEHQKMDEKVDCQEDLTELDPWDLNLTRPTPWYVTRSLNRQTQGGHWKEINKEFTAIRMDQQVCWKDIDKEITVIQKDHQLHMQVPQYMGMRRTLQFHHQDGSKVDWIMLEYQQLDDKESPVLLLQVINMDHSSWHTTQQQLAPPVLLPPLHHHQPTQPPPLHLFLPHLHRPPPPYSHPWPSQPQQTWQSSSRP
jgi:hypothetical protein